MDNKTERKVPGFGKIMLASGVGTLIVLVLIGLFKLLVFFGILGSIGSDSGVVVAKDSFLKIDLTQPVNERTPSELEGLMGNGSDVGFSDMLRCITAAAGDERIGGKALGARDPLLFHALLIFQSVMLRKMLYFVGAKPPTASGTLSA